MDDLDTYRAKRDFDATPEPDDPGRPSELAPRYSMQRHAARRLHYDLRLEHVGVLLSFAVTRGPSLDPGEKRLAVRTEDHPLTYLDFEGVIPEGNYGAGTVMLFDIGHWQPFHDVEAGFAKGHIHFALHGARLTGGWSLVRMAGRRHGDAARENWLLIKDDDAAAHGPDPVTRYETSVKTARAMDAIASGAPARAFGPRRIAARPRPPKPQLAEAGGKADDVEGRWFELKLDGYRALVTLGKGGARIFTRNGHDWSDRFAPLLPLIETLPAGRAVIDAEIVAGAGLQGFAALQKAVGAGGPFRLVAFDLLNLDGRDLTGQPLTKRRAALEALFADVPPLGPLRLSPVIEGDPAEALDLICRSGGEGLISKRTDARYRPGRSSLWQKIRCTRRDDFLVVGWEPSTSRARPFASLLLAEDSDDGLIWRGRVGTGFDEDMMADIAARLEKLATKTAPVRGHDAKRPRWVAPRLRVEIRYTEVTPDGRLRHPVFIGLRDDLAAPVPRRAKGSGDRADVAGVSISHPGRVVFPKAGLTKKDVAAYYARVADRMLPHLRDRPLALVRLPEGLGGERFFQKHVGKGFPDGIETREMRTPKGPRDVMTIASKQGLIGAVQMGTIEFHIGGARLDLPEKPDRLVFDLDPDEGLSFARVKAAAFEIADDLRGLGLDPWPLATGGKGLHVVVPLRRHATWETVTLFARTFAAMKTAAAPKAFTDSVSKSRREGRIFIDWLRNDPSATAVCPWSLRARDGAPLAHPVTWRALKQARKMPRQTPRDLRLSSVKEPGAKAVVLGEKVVEALAGLL